MYEIDCRFTCERLCTFYYEERAWQESKKYNGNKENDRGLAMDVDWIKVLFFNSSLV
jgi:hypothetical protein